MSLRSARTLLAVVLALIPLVRAGAQPKRSAPPATSAASTQRAVRTDSVQAPKRKLTNAEQIRPDSTVTRALAEGITHRWIRTAGGQVVDVVTLDLDAGARLRAWKAGGRCDGLACAWDIAASAAGEIGDTVIAATNASFWRAGSNTSIGATVINGQVVEKPGYKSWSSLMIFDDGTAAINRISLEGCVLWRGREMTVRSINRREDDAGIVVYNRYYGDSLPRGSRRSDSSIVAEATANRVTADIGDDTEGPVDTAGLIRAWRMDRLREDREHGMLKLVCVVPEPRRRRNRARPLARPFWNVGDTMRLVVQQVESGVVPVPENGVVVSLGVDNALLADSIKEGDTVRLIYEITPRPVRPVREVLTGTPRIVRNGEADPEYEVEGSKARRFIAGQLARTAVGITRDGRTLMLATVSSGSKSMNRTGMTLDQLASFMRNLGAWDAINFDGGGSATMAIRGRTLSMQGTSPTTRRVSNALIVVRPFIRRAPVAPPVDINTEESSSEDIGTLVPESGAPYE